MSTLFVSKKSINLVSNRLRVLRAEYDLSQMEVAAYLGCGHNRFWRIENGFQVPSKDERAKLAKLFKTDAASIFPEAA